MAKIGNPRSEKKKSHAIALISTGNIWKGTRDADKKYGILEDPNGSKKTEIRGEGRSHVTGGGVEEAGEDWWTAAVWKPNFDIKRNRGELPDDVKLRERYGTALLTEMSSQETRS